MLSADSRMLHVHATKSSCPIADLTKPLVVSNLGQLEPHRMQMLSHLQGVMDKLSLHWSQRSDCQCDPMVCDNDLLIHLDNND